MMRFATENYETAKKLTAIILIWLVYSTAYLLLVNINLETLAGYFALIGQVSIDILISVYAFKLYQKTEISNLKSIYLLFFISALSAGFADGIYHIAMNILDINYFNQANSLFEIPFIFFLLFQSAAWFKIFFIDFETSHKKKYHYIPYLIVSIFIFFTFVYIIPWKIHYLSKLGIYQLLDTLLEVIGFTLSAICLARAKNHPVRFLSAGYLLIISSDLLIRYKVISGKIPFLSAFESTWLLGLLFMGLGFSQLKTNPIKLLPLNSLQSHIAIWLLNLLLLFVLLFSLVNYFSPTTDVSDSLLLLMIPWTLCAIGFSKFFATKILHPLETLEMTIKEFLNEDASMRIHRVNRPITDIDDLFLLEKFVYDAFDLYKKNHYIEIEYAKMATQVAHDIQSPMVALNNYFKEAVQLDKAQYAVVESSLSRINEIASNLVNQYKKSVKVALKQFNHIDLLAITLHSLIEEKKLQFKNDAVIINLSLSETAATAYASFNTESLKRTLSNLINNAVESMDYSGTVTVVLQRRGSHLTLEIKDHGCGMPNDILDALKKHEKIPANSNGLGLPHAIKSIQEWGATYEIESQKNKGTLFRIIFPIQNAPRGIQEEIYIYDGLTIVIIDDDYSIFKLWEEKITKTGNPYIKFIYLSSPEELKKYILAESSLKHHLFLVDYYFERSNINGIELIESLYIENAILVTHSNIVLQEPTIKCIFKKHLLLTKIINLPKNPDLILLDDQKIITDIWVIESQKYGKTIVTFNNTKMLMKHIDLFDKNTVIYLDLNLDKESGDEVAKDLYTLGYKTLYITTGYDHKKVKQSPWILGITNKIPPFSKNFSIGAENE